MMEKIISFYRFFNISDTKRLRKNMQVLCEDLNLLGTILISAEGVNGTLSGKENAIKFVLEWLGKQLGIKGSLDGRWLESPVPPFKKMHVKEKKEIVALGRPDILPHRHNNDNYVIPEEWNKLLEDPDTLIIDTRNNYEIEIGTFMHAINPNTNTFREFPDFVNKLPESKKKTPIAMFCTGGIRCEKASILMIEQGFKNVRQLKGGILNYLEQTNDKNSLWNGECFVFDSRVAVNNDLLEGDYIQCYACRRPLSKEDIKSPYYSKGIVCPKCVDTTNPDRLLRFKEKNLQILLTHKRNKVHLGK